jgi:hypothetical protein
MSTIFKLLHGSNSNSTIDEEVNRIVGLEKEFKKVCIINLFAWSLLSFTVYCSVLLQRFPSYGETLS